jgi:hypothetical protein
MKCTTIVRHPGAIVLGCFFASVTGYVLFKDVLDGAPVTTNHVLAMAALVAALASGHMALPELKAGRVLSALTLGLLFVGSTGYVVISSGARNAETAADKAADIGQLNADRARVETERSKAQAMLDEERKAMARECASGKGRRCEGVQATVAVYTAAVAGHDAKLATMKPAQRENAGYAHAAGVLAAIPGVAAAPVEIERRLKLLLPFVVVVIAEIGTIAFLNIGLRHVRKLAPANPVARPGNGGKTSPEKPRGRRGRKADPKVIEFSDWFSRTHGRAPTGRDIRSQFPDMPRQTAHDYAVRSRASMPKLRVVAA